MLIGVLLNREHALTAISRHSHTQRLMNNDIIAGKWQLTGKAKAAWGELHRRRADPQRGQRRLAGLIQERYGKTKGAEGSPRLLRPESLNHA